MPVTATITPVQVDAQNAVRLFLLDLLGSNAVIIAAQPNRIPTPAGPNYVIMTPIRFERIATNLDSSSDVRFTGSISGTALTVQSVSIGQLAVGAYIFGPGIAPGTQITGGSFSNWTVNIAQNVAQEVMSAGAKIVQTTYFLTMQLDFHSGGGSVAAPDYTASAWAQTVATMWRDEYATTFFSNLPSTTLTPLYADDANMRPFINDQQQYEWRWVVDLHMEIDQTVVVPQTYADSATVLILDVDTIDTNLALVAPGIPWLVAPGVPVLVS